ncbi:MAG: molybdopterin molybdenumtransferase MoeA [Methylococcales bacterium]|nr:molybdopterin molybdenumtransferase MoeA [Methylococcales bacterium]
MIDSCSLEKSPLLTVDNALEKIRAAIQPVSDSETVTLKTALGHVLAEAVYSPNPIPHERNSAMDGYAFASCDVINEQPFTLTLIGTSWAGKPFQGQLQAGQCVRIFTGAVVPEQADSVIMQEHIQRDGQQVHFSAHTKPYQNVRAIGEDVQQGGLLCTQSKKLTAVDMALLATAGVSEVSVRRAINIAIFSTGDELIALGQPLATGQIYDSNRTLLTGLLSDACYQIADLGVIADNKHALTDAFTAAAKNYDVIISTGGASVGEADYVKDVLTECGQINFWKLAIKPGKPLTFGTIGACYFFGLPGNPVSAQVTFQKIVAPALQQLTGATATQPLQLTATCTTALKKSAGRQEFQRGILTQTATGELLVATAGQQGSNILSALSIANCYIMLPSDNQGVAVGDKVLIELFNVFF